jgi:hypothetical protein
VAPGLIERPWLAYETSAFPSKLRSHFAKTLLAVLNQRLTTIDYRQPSLNLAAQGRLELPPLRLTAGRSDHHSFCATIKSPRNLRRLRLTSKNIAVYSEGPPRTRMTFMRFIRWALILGFNMYRFYLAAREKCKSKNKRKSFAAD